MAPARTERGALYAILAPLAVPVTLLICEHLDGCGNIRVISEIIVMARRCVITGKGPRSGNNVSHANNRTKRWFRPNLARKKVWIPELGRSVRLKLSTTALKSIDRDGLLRYLKKNGLKLKDVT